MQQLIFMGPQGSGKGTQAKIISQRLGLCHISTGDLLRETTGDLGDRVKALIDEGNMVPDEMILQLLEERISQADCKNGYILDGYPRNLAQAETLQKMTGGFKVLEIYISDEEAVRRLTGRRNCPECGAIYNLNTAPVPKNGNTCDTCNTQLYQREDDTEGAIRIRLDDYHLLTEPVLNKYGRIKINGEQPIEGVTQEILGVLGH